MHTLLQHNLAFLSEAATGLGRTTYELARLRDFSEPRVLVILLVGTVVLLLGFVGWLYRRDTWELGLGSRMLLFVLRCTALAGLLVFFLGVERRTTREVTTNSQVVLLVDVSQSMGMNDGDASGVPAGPSRSERIAAALAETPLLKDLCQRHEVLVARFDQEVDQLKTLAKKAAGSEAGPPRQAVSQTKPTNSPGADWSQLLLPRGTETRLGDALRDTLRARGNAPLAAIVLVSDGAHNAGLEPGAAAQAARSADVPLFTIGIGSTRPHRSVSVSDLVAPLRAFPGDVLEMTAYVQGRGFMGHLVDVRLMRRPDEAAAAADVLVDSERVVLGPDGEILPVRFEVEPSTAGRFVYAVEVSSPVGDANAQDNRREVQVDVVDRKTRVLLIAGGPSRDYRFLRNLLYRDPTMIVDVRLQSGQPGMSQEADRILQNFPTSKDELFEYDCLVAIDADWTELDALQVDLLESWIADEAGGMIAVAGPVHTARWLRSTEHARVQALYSVDFQKRLTLLDDGHYAGENAWPIAMERAGREARFLWLENTGDESQAAWARFPGVYGYYSVKGPKLGATIYGRFSDPEAGWGDQQPVYMASHFYGAGQVFYIGSAELWRLRKVDPAYFDTVYTKIIRHVSQGRLLRGSSRGSLMVERDRYELGETVVVRARLTTAQHEPLLKPSVTAQLLRPDSTTGPVRLGADASQPGVFVGQFTAMQEGAYQVALSVPDQPDEQLSRRIQVRIPDRERMHPQRNETLLASLAKQTGASYYPELEAAIYGNANVLPVAEQIPDRTETRLVQGAPDEDFARRQMHWLLGIVAGALICEWLLRRLWRLA